MPMELHAFQAQVPGSNPGGSNMRGHSSMVERAFHQSLSSQLTPYGHRKLHKGRDPAIPDRPNADDQLRVITTFITTFVTTTGELLPPCEFSAFSIRSATPRPLRSLHSKSYCPSSIGSALRGSCLA
jgi:hypothetical protein